MATKTIKKYQLLKGFQLATGFMVNGKLIPVTFQNGIRKPYLMRGMYSTDDPAMQEAIESDNGFNEEFCLIHSDPGDEILKEVAESIPQEKPSEIPKPNINDSEKSEVLPDQLSIPENQEVKEEIPPSGPPVEERPSEPQITDYPEVTNLQEARQKMFDLFPGIYKPANLPNKNAVLNKAKENNITFSKL